MRVQHRHIIYIQGYDPRGLAQYYRMFRTELRKFGRLYQLQATISRPKVAPDDEIASWTIDTKAEDWQTRTAYDFLRFEDFIQQDLAAPIWRTVFSAVWIYWRLVFAGTIARFGKANWRFATFITYPHLMLLLEAACAGAIAFVFEKGLNALGIPDIFSITIATALFVALLGIVLKYTENATYVLYLLCDTIWTWEFSHRERPEWDQRIDRFAQHLVKTARSTDAEEIVIVGHSSGSFLSTEMLARALKLDPALGKHGPALWLMSTGSSLLKIALHPKAEWIRAATGRVADAPDVNWVEYQAIVDVISFYKTDPVVEMGLADRERPIVQQVKIRRMLEPATYKRFWGNFFRLHRQFGMGNELRYFYDYFQICCGPAPLARRVEQRDRLLDAFAEDGSYDGSYKGSVAPKIAARSGKGE